VAGPRDGLHGGGENSAQPKSIIEGLERDHNARGRAVGTGDEETRPAALLSLSLDHLHMIGIDLWD
jgi:hypothetical protein